MLFSQTNLANPETVATCTTRKAASLKKHAAAATAAAAAVAAAATSTTSTTDSKPKYVDRAAARREALGQNDADHGGKGKKKGAIPVREPSPEQPNQDGLEESNAGRKMLEKMVRPPQILLSLILGTDSLSRAGMVRWWRTRSRRRRSCRPCSSRKVPARSRSRFD